MLVVAKLTFVLNDSPITLSQLRAVVLDFLVAVSEIVCRKTVKQGPALLATLRVVLGLELIDDIVNLSNDLRLGELNFFVDGVLQLGASLLKVRVIGGALSLWTSWRGELPVRAVGSSVERHSQLVFWREW